LYLHAPRHGRAASVGIEVKIFHRAEAVPKENSMGAIFPLVAPSKVNVRSGGSWNLLRIVMQWPKLQVWVNGEQVQDLDLESRPELRYRMRSGYLGLSGLGYPIRFRSLRILELPGSEQWEDLFVADTDFSKWFISESSERLPVRFQALGGVLRASGLGQLATREKFRDFELSLYVRGPQEHNGGILLRSEKEGPAGSRHYEIQLHNVEEAHYATGSLYHYKRALYPRIENERWFPMFIRLQGKSCLVRANGDTILEYDRLENLEAGHIELQAHQPGSWLEFKEIRVKRL
jgi:hypothetical protein